MRRLSQLLPRSRTLPKDLTSDQERFFQAVQKGDLETAGSLINTINLSAVIGGRTALHVAADTTDNEEMVKLLLEKVFNVDVRTKDNDPTVSEKELGQTALEFAFTRANPKTIKLLVEAGADLTKFSQGKNDALTTITMMKINSSSKNREAFKDATIAILERMDPETILESLEYLIKAQPKAAGFLVGIIRDYSKLGSTQRDPENLTKQFVERFDPEQQKKFYKIASQFKVTKVLGIEAGQKSNAAVVDSMRSEESPSSSPSNNENTRKGCMSFLASLFRGKSGRV